MGIKHKEITTDAFVILAAKDSPIPWIKHLAADDRRLQEVQKVKEDFAELAESVCIAHRKIREGKEMYAKFKKKMAQRRRLI
ncbi:SNW domain-containing protein 1-like [Formica exsecta]|uniref:SNW domain-containing protein 1-like n=1 Tax=Formica exsecta TaxID=72781 RepID=UPI001141DCDA|nr:SNW domain-containing protein 1-like [Formica exsecta]